MVYLSISARWNISHASVQVLGGTSQKGADAAPSRRIKLDGDQMAGKNLQEQGGALLFFCPRLTGVARNFLQRLYTTALAKACSRNKLTSLRQRAKKSAGPSEEALCGTMF